MANKYLKHCQTSLLAFCLCCHSLQPAQDLLEKEGAACSWRSASERGDRQPWWFCPVPGSRGKVPRLPWRSLQPWPPHGTPHPLPNPALLILSRKMGSQSRSPNLSVRGKFQRSHLPTMLTWSGEGRRDGVQNDQRGLGERKVFCSCVCGLGRDCLPPKDCSAVHLFTPTYVVDDLLKPISLSCSPLSLLLFFLLPSSPPPPTPHSSPQLQPCS